MRDFIEKRFLINPPLSKSPEESRPEQEWVYDPKLPANQVTEIKIPRQRDCVMCKADHFHTINTTTDCSGLEIRLHKNGMLNVRYYNDDSLESQDVININFCPICGRKLRDKKKR